jgi:hypothetical protein
LKKWVFLILIAGYFCLGSRQELAWADPQAMGAAAGQSQSSQTSEVSVSSDRERSTQQKTSHKSEKKRKSFSGEKDAEGTLAPNRFDQDLIIKSRYEVNGQSLEVDTE